MSGPVLRRRCSSWARRPTPEPGPGEVRVRLAVSGITPGDTKKRGDWVGHAMPYPRVIPHSDGACVIDAVGPAVDVCRIGERVWVDGAQSYRAFGTAALATVVPEDQAGGAGTLRPWIRRT